MTSTLCSFCSSSKQFGGERGLLVGQAGGRLVDEEQVRAGQEQHADLEPLPLAVAEILHALIGTRRRDGRVSRCRGCGPGPHGWRTRWKLRGRLCRPGRANSMFS